MKKAMMVGLGQVLLLTAMGRLSTSQVSGINPEALIERIVAVDAKQRSEVSDVTFDAEYIEGKRQEDGSLKEDRRFIKKVYIKYLPDTAWYAEEFLEFQKGGEVKPEAECEKEAAKFVEKRKARKTRNISYPLLNPFYPQQRASYNIAYEGVAEEVIEGYTCHYFRVTAKEKQSDLLNGQYYFEAETFNLVKVEFSPAQLTKKTMFKLKRLDMTIVYGPTPEGYWLPRSFEADGSGKAAFFIGVQFAASEVFSNPRVNTGIPDDLFEVKDDK
ncbi:MAG TPA: hypothetical protein VN285_10035 [Candidatus Deferrimicrobium sp.]|nr:hypothetical protein [Candidatus Deferrimicrobium sp.]